MFVAPQVPSGPVNCRCIALRATCPSAATMVKGIQSVAMLSMCGRFVAPAEIARHRADADQIGQPDRGHDRIAEQLEPTSSLRTQGPIAPDVNVSPRLAKQANRWDRAIRDFRARSARSSSRASTFSDVSREIRSEAAR